MREGHSNKPGVRRTLAALFWTAVILLPVSFIFTIIGSAANLNGVLNAGIIGWLATSFLLFAWLVLWIWAKTETYEE